LVFLVSLFYSGITEIFGDEILGVLWKNADIGLGKGHGHREHHYDCSIHCLFHNHEVLILVSSKVRLKNAKLVTFSSLIRNFNHSLNVPLVKALALDHVCKLEEEELGALNTPTFNPLSL